MTIPVQVISLNRRADRRAWIAPHLRQCGVPFRFFDAVDAQTLKDNPLHALYDAERYARRNPQRGSLSDAEVSCTLSHYLVWCQAAAGPDAWTLVLEDDAVFAGPDPMPAIEAAAARCDACDVVLLDSLCWTVCRWKSLRLPGAPNRVYRANSPTVLATGYLLSRGAAGRLAEATRRDGIIRIVDAWLLDRGAAWSNVVTVRVVKPDLVYQHAALGSDLRASSASPTSRNHSRLYCRGSLTRGLVLAPSDPRRWPLLCSRFFRCLYRSYLVPPPRSVPPAGQPSEAR